jgi:hypothetical protein
MWIGGSLNCVQIWKETPIEGLGTDGSIIFKLIVNKDGICLWTGFNWLKKNSVAITCEHGSEHYVRLLVESVYL